MKDHSKAKKSRRLINFNTVAAVIAVAVGWTLLRACKKEILWRLNKPSADERPNAFNELFLQNGKRPRILLAALKANAGDPEKLADFFKALDTKVPDRMNAALIDEIVKTISDKAGSENPADGDVFKEASAALKRIAWTHFARREMNVSKTAKVFLGKTSLSERYRAARNVVTAFHKRSAFSEKQVEGWFKALQKLHGKTNTEEKLRLLLGVYCVFATVCPCGMTPDFITRVEDIRADLTPNAGLAKSLCDDLLKTAHTARKASGKPPSRRSEPHVI